MAITKIDGTRPWSRFDIMNSISATIHQDPPIGITCIALAFERVLKATWPHVHNPLNPINILLIFFTHLRSFNVI